MKKRDEPDFVKEPIADVFAILIQQWKRSDSAEHPVILKKSKKVVEKLWNFGTSGVYIYEHQKMNNHEKNQTNQNAQ